MCVYSNSIAMSVYSNVFPFTALYISSISRSGAPHGASFRRYYLGCEGRFSYWNTHFVWQPVEDGSLTLKGILFSEPSLPLELGNLIFIITRNSIYVFAPLQHLLLEGGDNNESKSYR